MYDSDGPNDLSTVRLAARTAPRARKDVAGIDPGQYASKSACNMDTLRHGYYCHVCHVCHAS